MALFGGKYYNVQKAYYVLLALTVPAILKCKILNLEKLVKIAELVNNFRDGAIRC